MNMKRNQKMFIKNHVLIIPFVLIIVANSPQSNNVYEYLTWHIIKTFYWTYQPYPHYKIIPKSNITPHGSSDSCKFEQWIYLNFIRSALHYNNFLHINLTFWIISWNTKFLAMTYDGETKGSPKALKKHPL